MLRLHSGRSAGFPLDQLRPGPPAGMGGLRRFIPDPNSGQEDREVTVEREPPAVGAIRAGTRPEGEARAEMEPRVPTGSWDVAGSGSSVLLRDIDRRRRWAVPVHGRRPGRHRDGAADVCGRCALVSLVATV